MKQIISLTLIVFLVIVAGAPLSADDHVFARQGDVVITQDEIDAAFARVPEHLRMAFIRDGGKVDQLVQSLLRYKQIVKDAHAQGYGQDTLVQNRIKLASEQELAQAWLEKVVTDAPEADYEAIAYENYLANPDTYKREGTVDVTHILIEIRDDRDEAQALELANRLHAELLADPSRFEAYVEEYSDDPGKSQNNGRYAPVRKGQMVQPFEDAAFALTEPGQLTEPVKTSFGFHLIRLNEKTPAGLAPFESVKRPLMGEARQARLAEYRKNYLLRISADDIEIPDGAVASMLKRHFGENLELAPDFENQ